MIQSFGVHTENDQRSGRTSGKMHGFTLVEVLVAISIFAVASLALQSGLVTHMRTNSDNEIRSGALQAAQEALDQLRVMDVSLLPSSGFQDSTRTIGGRAYNVRVSFCSVSSFCADSSVRHLAAAVTFQGRQRYRTETVFTQLR